MVFYWLLKQCFCFPSASAVLCVQFYCSMMVKMTVIMLCIYYIITVRFKVFFFFLFPVTSLYELQMFLITEGKKSSSFHIYAQKEYHNYTTVILTAYQHKEIFKVRAHEVKGDMWVRDCGCGMAEVVAVKLRCGDFQPYLTYRNFTQKAALG